MSDADESCRGPLALPIDPFEIADLQAAVNTLASLAQQDRAVDHQLSQDVLLQVGLRGQEVRLPKQGLVFRCEACGADGRVYGQSGPRVAFVPWVWFPNRERMDAAMRYVSTDVADRLFVQPFAVGWAGYRVLVICAACARSHHGKRGLQRCWHEERSDSITAEWRRCEQVVKGRDFCAAHSSRDARYRRENGQARRASANVPYVWTDVTPTELGSATGELISLARAIRDGDLERVKNRETEVFRAAKRIADN